MKLERAKFLILCGALLIGVPFFVHTTTYGWQWDWHPQTPLTSAQSPSVQRLEESVRYLAEDIGPRNQHTPVRLQAAAGWLEEEFRRLGYRVRRQTYTIGQQEFDNILADHPAGPRDGPLILLGAHYDTHHNPGADDNASGVAALLELARLLRDHPFRVRVRFAAFVNEEPPFFLTEGMGSYQYARKARAEQEDLRGALILETIGYYSRQPFSQRYLAFMGPFYPNQGDFIAVVGNFDSGRLAGQLTRDMRRSRLIKVEKLVAPEFVPGVYFSDHWSFWQFDYPAVMLTDTAFLRNPHYHTASDLPQTLDYHALARVVWSVRDGVIAFAKEQADKTVKEKTSDD